MTFKARVDVFTFSSGVGVTTILSWVLMCLGWVTIFGGNYDGGKNVGTPSLLSFLPSVDFNICPMFEFEAFRRNGAKGIATNCTVRLACLACSAFPLFASTYKTRPLGPLNLRCLCPGIQEYSAFFWKGVLTEITVGISATPQLARLSAATSTDNNKKEILGGSF